MDHICQKVQKMILIRKIDQNSTFDRYLLVQVHPHFEEETRIWPPRATAP